MMTREANHLPHDNAPAWLFLWDAFARHSTYVEHRTFGGDLRAACKRKSGNPYPYNHVARLVPIHSNQQRNATC